MTKPSDDNFDYYLTVGQIRKSIENLPDDMPVLYQRIEDVYFDKHGWTTQSLLWEKMRVSAVFANTMTEQETANTEIIEGTLYFREMSEYIGAFSAYKHPEKDVFVINAHY